MTMKALMEERFICIHTQANCTHDYSSFFSFFGFAYSLINENPLSSLCTMNYTHKLHHILAVLYTVVCVHDKSRAAKIEQSLHTTCKTHRRKKDNSVAATSFILLWQRVTRQKITRNSLYLYV
jgi:hypothetical protein